MITNREFYRRPHGLSINKYTNTQVHKYTNTKIREYKNTQVHKYIEHFAGVGIAF